MTESYSVKFMEFTRVVSKAPDAVVCFFEGEDEKYYSSRVSHGLSGFFWHGIDTGGKKVVLDVFSEISKHPVYRSYRYLFFIDRDFEHWFENPNSALIYVTPCYSIENLYISEDVFKKVLAAEFGATEFNHQRHSFKDCVELLRRLKREFGDALFQFNVWVKAHRIMERDGLKAAKLNVRNIKTEDLVSVLLDGVVTKYDSEDPSSVFKDTGNFVIDECARREAETSLQIDEWETDYRGKQVIDFLRMFLVKLREDISSTRPVVFDEKAKIRLTLSKDSIISELSQYAETPECLMGFLASYKTLLSNSA